MMMSRMRERQRTVGRSCAVTLISHSSAHIAYQHHEKPTGLGYPRQLKEDRISPLAKIVGVADAYDAMTSERIYRRGIFPYEALKIMRRLRGVQFSVEIVDLLVESVVGFPVGCMVRLNSKEMGIVVDVNHNDHARPVVRLLYHADGTKMRNLVELDSPKSHITFFWRLWNEAGETWETGLPLLGRTWFGTRYLKF